MEDLKKTGLQALVSVLYSIILGTGGSLSVLLIMFVLNVNTNLFYNDAHTWVQGCWTVFPGWAYAAEFYASAPYNGPNLCLPGSKAVGTATGLVLSYIVIFGLCNLVFYTNKMTMHISTVFNFLFYLVPLALLSIVLFFYAFESKGYSRQYWIIYIPRMNSVDWYLEGIEKGTISPLPDDVKDISASNIAKAFHFMIFIFGFLVACQVGFYTLPTKIDAMYNAFHFLCLYVVAVIYGSSLVAYYKPPSDDVDKMFARLFLHTVLVEVVNVSARQNYYRGPTNMYIGCMFFALTFGGLYGRLLVAAVSDETLLLISSIGVGIIEVFARLTAFQRDNFAAIVLAKIKGKEVNALDLASLKLRKGTLIVLETEVELGSIIFAAVFFVGVCHIDGPMKDQKLPPLNREVARYILNFKIEVPIISNALIQVAVEIVTDMASFMFEAYVVKINPFEAAGAAGKDAISRLRFLYLIFYTCYVLPYSTQLFLYPQKFPGSSSAIHGVDLDLTWISVIPATVEIAYFIDFAQRTMG